MQSFAFSALLAALALHFAPCWAAGRGTFGEFRRSLNATEHGYRLLADFTGAAPCKEIEAFEVRAGDAGKDAWYDDASNDRERSELTQINKDQKNGDTYWYGWYIYFPQDYKNIFPAKVTLGQFHQQNARPAWMFENGSGGYWLKNNLAEGLKDKFQLVDENDLRGKWHKVEVHAHWSKNTNGFLKVWVDGAIKADYQGATMSAERVYFKYGIYRSFVSRYKQTGKAEELPAQSVYFAGVKRGSSRLSIQP